MHREFTFFNLIIILHIVFYGLLLLAAKSDYWSFLDFLTQPLADFEFIGGGSGGTGAVTYVVFLLVDVLKEILLNALIAINNYNLISSLLVIKSGILLVSAAYLLIDYKNLFSQASVALLVIIGLVFLSIDEGITKSDVDQAWAKFPTSDMSGIDYFQYLQQGRFETVDTVLSKVHQLYVSGEIDEQLYDIEFGKFESDNDRHLPLFDRWLDETKHKDLALMARGLYYEELGWESRGTRYASKTSEAQFEGMRKNFELATSDHRAALAMNNRLLLSYKSLINMASSGEADYDRKALYLEAREYFPGSYVLAYTHMSKLQPKWGGSHREMRELARMERARATIDPKLITLAAEELLFRGNEIQRNKKYSKAERKYRQALLYSPREGYFRQLYYTFSNREDYTSAKNVLDDCLEFRPRNNFCLVERAVNSIKLNDGDAALADATAASNNDGLSQWNTNNLGWVYEHIAYLDRAFEMYKRTLEKAPADAYALKRLYIMSHEGQVPYDAALPYFKTSTVVEPENAQHWIWYADTLEDINRKESVIAYKRYLDLVDHDNEDNKDAISHVEHLIAEIERE